MKNGLSLSVSPHIHCGRTTRLIMLDVLIALLPAVIAGTVIFGTQGIGVIAVCVGICVLSEWAFCRLVKKEQTIGDLSAVVTGVLLALNLPVTVPLWQAAVGSVFAIIVVKCVFGGIGCNLVNPAVTARVFMLVSFGNIARNQGYPLSVDTVGGATPLVELANNQSVSLTDLFFGTTGGAFGETCALALLIGLLYLLIRRVITWHIPVTFIASAFLMTWLLKGFDVMTALSWILSGGLLLGAVFMATDYVTSPSTAWGKVIFGIGCGLLTVVIRFWSSYPEGVSFAILLMNIVAPYIENATRRPLFGGDLR